MQITLNETRISYSCLRNCVFYFSVGIGLESYDSGEFDVIAILKDFPGGILYKHSACAWIAAYEALKKKAK